MARNSTGRVFKRGKYYYVQFYQNAKEIKRVLKDSNGKSVTTKAEALKAKDLFMAPYLAKDEVQRREQAHSALLSAREKAEKLEERQNAIKVVEACELALKKPRRKKLTEKSCQTKRSHWKDFALFMEDQYPKVIFLNQIEFKHANSYAQQLIEKGKFDKEVSFSRNGRSSSYVPKSKRLSPRTVNWYISTIREIFKLLLHDTSLAKNPFDGVAKLELVQEKREAFSMEELRKIKQNGDDFILAIFTIGLCTGLREADICLLKWDEVDFGRQLIRRVTRKTGKEVLVPIMQPLLEFLQAQYKKSSSSEFVLPEHAEIYTRDDSGISRRVKKFLESIDIVTTKIPEGRTRAVSIKDVHSLRHSFCYYAGLYNIPLAVVQAVVGHMSSEMTKHYMMHATGDDVKKAFENMPDIFGFPQAEQPQFTSDDFSEEQLRQQLRSLADVLPITQVRALVEKHRRLTE